MRGCANLFLAPKTHNFSADGKFNHSIGLVCVCLCVSVCVCVCVWGGGIMGYTINNDFKLVSKVEIERIRESTCDTQIQVCRRCHIAVIKDKNTECRRLCCSCVLGFHFLIRVYCTKCTAQNLPFFYNFTFPLCAMNKRAPEIIIFLCTFSAAKPTYHLFMAVP